ncbi:MAG: murein biosynthesis integral membrane protein MurJ [Chloroflexi bacterium]|nr:MAG: murein biosynthesis integral membrane protein MurJ [Chloroflexota bacterium]
MTQNNRSVARSAGILMAAFVAANLAGLLRQMLINRAFGTGAALDEYFAAFRVPDLLFNLLAGGALGSAFLPVFTGQLLSSARPAAWALASALLNSLCIVLLLLAGLAALFAPAITRTLLAPGWDAQQVARTVQLMRIMLLSTAVFGASSVLMSVHHAHNHFLAPALAPVLYNAGIAAGALWLAPRYGVSGLAYGVVLGALLHLAAQLPPLWRYAPQYHARLGLADPVVRRVAALMVPRVLGLAAWQINFWVNTAVASTLPAGSLAALVIAFQVFTFPQAVIAQALATALFPRFSAMAARGEYAALRDTLAASLRAVLYLALPATAGMWLLGKPLLRLLFEGNAFDTAATQMVYWALAWYALGLAAHCGVELAARAYYAVQDTRTPLLAGGIAVAINVALSPLLAFVFGRMHWLPHGGPALANTIATTLELLLLLLWLRSALQPGAANRAALLQTVLRSTAAVLLMGAALAAWLAVAPASVLVTSLVGVLLGAAVYWAATLALASPEARRLPQLLLRRQPESE